MSSGTDVDPKVALPRRLLQRYLSPGEREFVVNYLTLLAVGFLLVAAAGGFLTYSAQTTPETEARTETVGTWSVQGGFDHGAVVQRETAVFAAGERLEDRSLYFSGPTPILEGQYILSHEGETEAASGTIDLQLVIEATEEQSAAGGGPEETETVVYWRETEPLGEANIEDLPPGEQRRVEFELNTTALNGRIDAIEAELGASPGTTSIAVVAETDLSAEVAGQRFADARSDRLEISPGGGTYSVEADLTESESYEATRTTQVPVEPSPLTLYGGPILLLVGLLGAGATVAADRMDLFVLTDREKRRLEYARTRDDLDEWISAGTVPDEDDRTVVELDSLRDLVNVAIDSDRRVIEQSGSPRFVVLDDDARYVFDPPAVVLDRPAGDSAASPSQSAERIGSETGAAADGDGAVEDGTASESASDASEE
jgi:hypothetical protein